MKTELTIHDTELDTWFERDRAHVDLKNKATGETIIEWWDESVAEAVEDGFLDPRDYHGSAFDYAKSLGLLKPKRARKPRKKNPTIYAGRGPVKVRGASQMRLAEFALKYPGWHTMGKGRKDKAAMAALAKRGVLEVAGDQFRWKGDDPTVPKKNPVSIADKPAVTELVLYAENTGPGSQGHERALWNQRVSIIANLKRKVKKGIYDPALAAKLWTYWADSAAKAYEVYHGSGKPSLAGSPFTVATRREAGKIFEANFRDEVHEGMKKNPVPRPTGGTYGAGAKLRARSRRAARTPATKRHAQYVIAIRRTTGAIQFYTGAGFGPRSQAAHFMNTDTAQQVAGGLQYKSVIAPYSTPEKTIRAALLGKR